MQNVKVLMHKWRVRAKALVIMCLLSYLSSS